MTTGMFYLERMNEWVESMLLKAGITSSLVDPARAFLYGLLIFLVSLILRYVFKEIIIALVGKFVKNSSNRYDDVFLEKKVFHKLSHLAPVLAIYLMAPALLTEFPRLIDFTYLITSLYIVIVVFMLVFSILEAAETIYNSFDISRARPIKIYIQITKIILGLIAGILVLSLLLGEDPKWFLTGMGAAMAILLLIFKDTILGFVGGVQVTANNMLQIGDWIEMPKYGADGDVVEIALHTVKVQNFDRTITTIPTYALVTDSFKNWRGMVQSGGRRIKRAIFIDARTVKFCDKTMLEQFETMAYLKDYIRTRRKEIEEFNQANDFDEHQLVNGRRMTNLGTFRAYVLNYLMNHPKIHKDAICMVRQLEPNEKGIPLEIYAFTNDVNWVNYEGIQSDIFDHIFSVMPYFHLKVFQYPTEISFSAGPSEQLPAAQKEFIGDS
ncbi:MAG: mechanosensitive ion channel [Bacteroidales bacterium]